jgi:transposase-like protein
MEILAQLPSTMASFEEQFSDETDCINYLRALRWPNGFICSKCDCIKGWETAENLIMCRQCGHRFSLTSGTIFHQTHKPLLLWFRAMWYVTNQKNGVSALGLQRALNLGSYHTAWTWLHKLRTAMVNPDRDRLSGTVEVDEALYGGVKKGKRGRGADGKELVLVAVEDVDGKPGRIRLIHIEDASADSILPAIKQAIEPGSTIRSDGWKAYLSITKKGYKHQRLKSKSKEPGEDLLPMADLVISLMKRWLLGTHQGGISASHLGYYLDEFTFRFNRRNAKERGLLFQRLVEGALKIPPVKNNLIEGGKYKNHGN